MDTLTRTPNLSFYDHYMMHMVHSQIMVRAGVYKQWTGLLEWWNTGMVDWKVFFNIYHVVASL